MILALHTVAAGHSLGGALAVIAAHELTRIYPQAEITIYTFGAPRVSSCSCCKGMGCAIWAGVGTSPRLLLACLSTSSQPSFPVPC